jgi:hypothetical protein
MTAKPAPKLDSPALMDRRKWMRRHHRKQLRNLCLPGSHQSGTDHMQQKLRRIPMSEGWSRCQKLSVEAQLYGGIRFFDFRVMTHGDQVWLHHNVVICRQLLDVFRHIKEFVTENPSEIVFIHLDRDGKNVSWGQVHEFIHECFGDNLIMEHMKDMLIGQCILCIASQTLFSLLFLGDIVDQGRNVVISGVPDVAYSWKSIRYRWPNKPWPEELRADMEMVISDLHGQAPQDVVYWYKAECTPDPSMVIRNIGGVPGVWVKNKRGAVEKFDFVEDLAAAVNQVVYEVLQPLQRIPFHVLSTDFVQDDIVGHIIQLNDAASEGLYSAEESLDVSVFEDNFSESSSLMAPKSGRNQSVSNISVGTNRSAMNASFDVRLHAAPPVEVKETNM